MKNKIVLLFLVSSIMVVPILKASLVDIFLEILDEQKQKQNAPTPNIDQGAPDLQSKQEVAGQNYLENVNVVIEDSNVQESEKKAEGFFKLFGISCDKTQLMYFGVGAVAIIVLCGVTYVLYKNKENWTLKEVGNYMQEQKFAVSGVISAIGILAIVGIYAKQQGITLQSAGNWMTNFLGFNSKN